jgi:hypothetical protein
LKTGRKPTDDCEQKYYNFYCSLRKHFYDFREVLIENKSPELRANMNKAEHLARYIDMYLEENGMIEYTAFLQLLELLLYIAEIDVSKDELSSMLESLAL